MRAALATWYRELVTELPQLQGGMVLAPTALGIGIRLRAQVRQRDDESRTREPVRDPPDDGLLATLRVSAVHEVEPGPRAVACGHDELRRDAVDIQHLECGFNYSIAFIEVDAYETRQLTAPVIELIFYQVVHESPQAFTLAPVAVRR